MKRFMVWILGCWLIATATSAVAATLYVSDLKTITARTGPGNSHRIITMLDSGDAVEVIQPGEEWTLVRLSSGKEGYVISRFLTSETPKSIILAELQTQHTALKARAEELEQENTTQKSELERLRAELAQSQEALKGLQTSFDALKKESAGFLELQSNYEQATSELTVHRDKADQLERDLSKVQQLYVFRWVLTGAGILLVGYLFGYSAKRQRRRSSLY